MMSTQDKMAQCTNFSPHQWFELPRSTVQAKQQKKFRNPTIKIISVIWTPSTAQARRQKKLQHPTRPVDNVALMTKGLQEIKHNYWMGQWWKICNKNKFIWTINFPSVHETWHLKVLILDCCLESQWTPDNSTEASPGGNVREKE